MNRINGLFLLNIKIEKINKLILYLLLVLIFLFYVSCSYGNAVESKMIFPHQENNWIISSYGEKNQLNYIIESKTGVANINLTEMRCPNQSENNEKDKKISDIIDSVINDMQSEYRMKMSGESKIELFQGIEFTGKLLFWKYSIGENHISYNAFFIISNGKSIWTGDVESKDYELYYSALKFVNEIRENDNSDNSGQTLD